MPLPLAAIGAISAGVGSAVNSGTTLATNFAQQRFSRKMYERVKNDNIAFYHMQNEYNSPVAQMERLKAAGLNPALIYGQSSGGAAGQAANLSTPDVQNVQYRDPQFGNIISNAGAGYLNTILDFEIKQAQVDNLKAQGDLTREEILLKAAYRNRSKFDLDFESELRGISADYRRERVRQMRAEIDFRLDENQRRALLTTSNLSQAAARIAFMEEQKLNLRQQRAHSREEIRRIQDDRVRIKQAVENMKKDNVLKDLEIKLEKQGINKSDPTWIRIVGRIMNGYLSGESSTPNSMWDIFFNSLRTEK